MIFPLVNPGFEDGLTGWDPLPNPDAASSVFVSLLDPALAHSGDRCLQWTGDNRIPVFGSFNDSKCLTTQRFQVPTNGRARVSLWIRAIRTDTDVLAGGRLYIRGYDADGTQIFTTGGAGSLTFGGVTDTDWQRTGMTLDYSADLHEAALELNCFGGPGTQILFDDVVVELQDAPPNITPTPPPPPPSNTNPPPSGPAPGSPGSKPIPQASSSPRLPRPDEPIADGRGLITRSWRNYFLDLAATGDLTKIQDEISSLRSEIETPGGIPADARVFGDLSVASFGLLADGLVRFTLVNDQEFPGNTLYYGTGFDGLKGWFNVSDAIEAVDGETTKEVADTGVVSIGSSLSMPAGEAIHGRRIVIAVSGEAFHPLLSNNVHAGACVGLALQAAALGDNFKIRQRGQVSDPAWSWSPGPVFCGDEGVLTQTAPATGWVLVVGRAIDSTTLDIELQLPMIRSI